MTIKVGDRLPDASFLISTPDGPVAKTTSDIFKGKKVVLFAVPGAFTPTCHRNHLPGYVKLADEIRAKGVDTIAVTAANDVFVMQAWAEASGASDKITFLADGNADFAKAIGLSMDASKMGLGTRSLRYSMIVDDGIIQALNVEDVPSNADVSTAENILKQL
jgi:Peroxiredoxin